MIWLVLLMILRIITYGDKIIEWTFVAVAAIAAFGRFYLRYRYSRLHWDDFFNGLAFLCYLSSVIGSQVVLIVDSDTVLEWQLGLFYGIMFWATLFSVKASFLALCWLIFHVSPTFRKAWWTVTVYTFVAFWPTVIAAFWQCGNAAQYDNPSVCLAYTSQPYQKANVIGASVDTALHISSDLLILALPLAFLRGLQMSTVQKLSASAVFALVIIDILMGILRNVTVAIGFAGINQSTSFAIAIAIAMEDFEPGIAVIVCALPAYRVLLPKTRKQRNPTVELQRHAAAIGTMELRRSKSTQTFEADWPLRDTQMTYNMI